MVALHAMKFWKDLQDAGEAPQFPYTVRFLFGANEESGMADVAYYHKHSTIRRSCSRPMPSSPCATARRVATTAS